VIRNWHVSWRYRQGGIVGLISDIPMLHCVIDIAVTNGECSGQGRVIHESEGFTDHRNETVLQYRIEESIWGYGCVSEHVQNAKLAGVRACDVDQESATAHLRVGVDG
jgi:hypothetical protein